MSLEICGEHGDEICYEGPACPACGQIDNLQEERRVEVDDLEITIDNLEEQLSDKNS